MKNERIQQIIPANGWLAVYATQEGDQWRAETWPFPLWALLEDEHGEQRIVGFDGADYLSNVEDNDNFLGYVDPGKSPEQITELWQKEAQHYGRQRKKIR